ncbi:hypothetical protein COL13_26375 [Bacillus cereus]|nr:hypothetical protein COL13_26375 [Bacillus cereus]
MWYKDPFEGMNAAIKAMEYKDPFEGMNAAIKAMEYKDPFEGVNEVIKAMEYKDPFEGMDAAIKAMKYKDPFEGINEVIKAMKYKDPFEEMNAALAAVKANPFKEMNEAIKNIKSMSNFGIFTKETNDLIEKMEPLNINAAIKIKEVEPFVQHAFEERSVGQSKGYYKKVTQAIKQANADEILNTEETTMVNVISDAKYKAVCYKLTMGLMIILMSCTLTSEEIDKVATYVISLTGLWKAFNPTPSEKSSKE